MGASHLETEQQDRAEVRDEGQPVEKSALESLDEDELAWVLEAFVITEEELAEMPMSVLEKAIRKDQVEQRRSVNKAVKRLRKIMVKHMVLAYERRGECPLCGDTHAKGRWVDRKGPKLRCKRCRKDFWPEARVVASTVGQMNIKCPDDDGVLEAANKDGKVHIRCSECHRTFTWLNIHKCSIVPLPKQTVDAM